MMMVIVMMLMTMVIMMMMVIVIVMVMMMVIMMVMMIRMKVIMMVMVIRMMTFRLSAFEKSSAARCKDRAMGVVPRACKRLSDFRINKLFPRANGMTNSVSSQSCFPSMNFVWCP